MNSLFYFLKQDLEQDFLVPRSFLRNRTETFAAQDICPQVLGSDYKFALSRNIKIIYKGRSN